MSSFSAAGDGGSPPLRSSLRRQEGGGTADLLVRRVNSRSRCSAGGAVGVEAASERIMVLQRRPLYVGVLRGSGVALAAFGAPRSLDLWSSCCPRADGVATPAFALCGDFVLPLLRRRAFVSICGGSGSVKGFVWVSLSSSFLWPAEVARREGVGGARSGFGWRGGGGGSSGLLHSGRPWRRGEWWSGEGALGGWPGRCGDGWMMGGLWKQVLRLCSFSVLGVRRVAAAGSAAYYKVWRCLLSRVWRYGGSGGG